MRGDEFMKSFTNSYMGRAIDFDGAWDVQCVDGAKIGMMLLGCKNPPATGMNAAYGYWYNYESIPYLRDNYTRIYNLNDVQVGDMLIFSTPAGTGHVSWCAEGGMSFGQNQNGANDGFTLKPISNWTFLGALRFNGFDGVSQPVSGLNGEDMNYQYEETDKENFENQIVNKISKKPIYYRKPYIYLKD